MKIITEGKKTSVSSPYHPDFVAGARKLNGKWNANRWEFDSRDEQRVRDLMLAVYGTDGSKVPTKDIQIEITAHTNNPYFAYGREIVARKTRDSRVILGDGVVVLDGDFPSSCGSSKYPALLRDGTVTLEVCDVPVSLIK